ncbi:HemY domain-containing protein [Candidatus Nitrosoglobus terrae]|uniref:HemY domain-containing protein n=1 Tax=Candidatus Nitrosoglobus terrae TaxID=1630141 RepID=A0A1Q2SPW7_9GAMM|nr:heme biosynthesis protein HemY [Candidatus Nitrosoglobus terrae]BAW81184.1 HemY domain-containing protein [Candidatus Nitrosoglobus terrae]
MKTVIFALMALILGVSLGLIARDDPGYIIVGYGQWMMEMTLVLAAIMLGLVFTGGYFLLRLIAQTWHVPQRLGELRQRWRATRADKLLIEGLIDLEEGNWKRAEHTLVKDITYSSAPIFNYITAARAAQNQGAYERRDRYLSLARETAPIANFAIELAQAELQINSDQFDQALATLNHLRAIDPRHPQPLKLLKSLYLQQQDWGQLLRLLPELRKRHLVDQEESQSLEVMAHVELLQEAVRSGSGVYLAEEWKSIPVNLQKHPQIVAAYVYALLDRGDQGLVEPILQEALNKNWSDELIYLYGIIQSDDQTTQLAWAEAWVSEYGNNPWLLLTLGRIAKHNSLWGKARQYLETSITYAPRPETYHDLGEVFEKMGDLDAALKCYNKGLSMSTGGAIRESAKLILPNVVAQKTSLSTVKSPSQIIGPTV